MLAVLSKQKTIQETTQRCLLSARDAASQDHALLPFLPREQPPWYLSSLPAFGLSRLSYMLADTLQDEIVNDAKAVDVRQYSPMAKSEDVKSYFKRVFEGEEGVQLRAESVDTYSAWFT